MHASGFRGIPAGSLARRVPSVSLRALHSSPPRFASPSNGAPKPTEDPKEDNGNAKDPVVDGSQDANAKDPEAQANSQASGVRSKNHAVTSQRGRLARQRVETALPPVQLPPYFLTHNVSLNSLDPTPIIPHAIAADAGYGRKTDLSSPGQDSNKLWASRPVKEKVDEYFRAAINLLARLSRVRAYSPDEIPFERNEKGEIAEEHFRRSKRLLRLTKMMLESADLLIKSARPGKHPIFDHAHRGSRPFWWTDFHQLFDRQQGKFPNPANVFPNHQSDEIVWAMNHPYSLAQIVPGLPVNTINVITAAMMRELRSTPPAHYDPKSSQRPINIVSLSGYGGRAVARSLSEVVAHAAGADVVHLDAAELSVLVGQYIGQDWAYSRGSLSMLGFRVAEINGKLASDPGPATRAKEEEDDDGDSNVISLRALASPWEEELQKKAKQRGYEVFTKWEHLKIDKVLNHILQAPRVKLKPGIKREKPIIIHLHDFVELSMTLEGTVLISRLRALVDAAWQQGTKISILGTSSVETPSDEYQEALREASVRDFVVTRHIELQQPTEKSHELEPWKLQKADYVSENHDNIKKMIYAMDQSLPLPGRMDNGYLGEMARHKGLMYEPMRSAIMTAPELYYLALGYVDEAKRDRIPPPLRFFSVYNEFASGLPYQQKPGQSLVPENESSGTSVSGDKAKANESESSASKLNEYEKRVSSGQIFAKDIRVTFADVHAPAETISALKLLTSLALVRPDAFSYGVLASDKIPGCLLYGPPGTGKTMLAKAVAKESGANMLEVSGATVNDKWVGESEKLVKAVFSLAKRLEPCVVFIDEADSLFANRSMQINRSRRDNINQFLKEWDGMRETNAFIMVATNRPFDLDDAVLRRLPRKLLVDLPMADDRLAILKLLTRGEQLDGAVSLEDLAKRTPFYSGSDLKNVCVAAAMAAVEEENEIAARHDGAEPYVYPERRTLRYDHFEKALQQIPASISEDMTSLKEIRKFDEEFGNRKRGRKKGMGFGILEEATVDATEARIRP